MPDGMPVSRIAAGSDLGVPALFRVAPVPPNTSSTPLVESLMYTTSGPSVAFGAIGAITTGLLTGLSDVWDELWVIPTAAPAPAATASPMPPPASPPRSSERRDTRG